MSIRRFGLALAALITAASLGACNSLSSVPGPTAAAALPAEPAAASLPEGSGCSPSIARTQAVVDSDIATENLNAAVGKRFSADLGNAAAACSAGKSAEGLRLLAAAKARYGYR